jgi:cytoskeletal protein CcmA (bactofilin family)
MEKLVNIGQSIQIKGELTGNEDLTIEGKVDGKVVLKDHNLTIGANGKITAEIQAKTVMVLGEVVGNISADDKVEVAATGSMKGDIVAPRVVLADGARFKGSIDMDRKPGAAMPPKPGTPGTPGGGA